MATAATVGNLAVHVVHEQELDLSAGRWLFPNLDDDPDRAGDLPDHVDVSGAVRLDSHSFALTVDGQRIVIDTGVGNAKPRANSAWNDLDTAYLSELAEAGFRADDIDLVVLTHLHTDHVGWNTRREGDEWVPTFPNAQYVTAQAEWDYWTAIELEPERAQMFADSILPVRDAGLLTTVEVGAQGIEVAAGVRLLPTPGHTPGQVAVAISAGGEEGVISGDAIHHPIQILHPDLVTYADLDADATVATRRALLARVAERRSILLGTHFTAPVAGRVLADADRYRFVPLDASDSRL